MECASFGFRAKVPPICSRRLQTPSTSHASKLSSPPPRRNKTPDPLTHAVFHTCFVISSALFPLSGSVENSHPMVSPKWQNLYNCRTKYSQVTPFDNALHLKVWDDGWPSETAFGEVQIFFLVLYDLLNRRLNQLFLLSGLPLAIGRWFAYACCC
jgi:hypothetical protein